MHLIEIDARLLDEQFSYFWVKDPVYVHHIVDIVYSVPGEFSISFRDENGESLYKYLSNEKNRLPLKNITVSEGISLWDKLSTVILTPYD